MYTTNKTRLVRVVKQLDKEAADLWHVNHLFMLLWMGYSLLAIPSSSKWWQKMKWEMRWLFDYLVNFYFIYFLLHVEELIFCFQFFSFNCNFDFLSVMTNKQNVVLFLKKLQCRRVMWNEWLIMSGHIFFNCYVISFHLFSSL